MCMYKLHALYGVRHKKVYVVYVTLRVIVSWGN